MSLTRAKQVITAIMLLIFVGQVSATAIIPCKMGSQQQPESMDMTQDMQGMDHSSHMMGMNSYANDSEMPDCCDSSANCSMSSCLSILASTPLSMNKIQNSYQKPLYPASTFNSQTPNSLYRPPILS